MQNINSTSSHLPFASPRILKTYTCNCFATYTQYFCYSLSTLISTVLQILYLSQYPGTQDNKVIKSSNLYSLHSVLNFWYYCSPVIGCVRHSDGRTHTANNSESNSTFLVKCRASQSTENSRVTRSENVATQVCRSVNIT